jgi:hypothetical protein
MCHSIGPIHFEAEILYPSRAFSNPFKAPLIDPVPSPRSSTSKSPTTAAYQQTPRKYSLLQLLIFRTHYRVQDIKDSLVAIPRHLSDGHLTHRVCPGEHIVVISGLVRTKSW